MGTLGEIISQPIFQYSQFRELTDQFQVILRRLKSLIKLYYLSFWIQSVVCGVPISKIVFELIRKTGRINQMISLTIFPISGNGDLKV